MGHLVCFPPICTVPFLGGKLFWKIYTPEQGWGAGARYFWLLGAGAAKKLAGSSALLEDESIRK